MAPSACHSHSWYPMISAKALNSSIPVASYTSSQRRRSPSPTRAQRRSGSGPQRRRGSPRLGGGVSGSASRQSPRALASVLRAPAGDPAYAPTSPLPPLLYRGSPASCPGWPGLGSAGAANGVSMAVCFYFIFWRFRLTVMPPPFVGCLFIRAVCS